jgi:hypothetical protein
MTTRTKTSNKRAGAASPGAEAQLKAFIEKFDRPNQKLIREVRRALRARFPTAIEMVYDNYNFFVIGYSPTERPSDAIVSIAAGANGVSLCFLFGARLPDPDDVLTGGGNQTRFVRINSADQLRSRALKDLLAAAESNSAEPFPTRGRRQLIIKSISAKQRPRRKSV